MNSKKDMDKGTLEQRKNMVNIMSENEEFIIIGLTGRVGSGCSEAAQIFGSSFNELELPYSGYKNDNERDLRILYRYASAHWLKFDIIKSRTIISTFLLNDFSEFERQFQNKYISKEEIYKKLSIRMRVDDIKKKIETIVLNLKRYDFINLSEIEEKMGKEESYKEKGLLELCRVICNIIGKYYRCVDSGECLINRSQFLSAIEQSLFSVSRIGANALIQIFPDASSFFEILNTLNCSLESTSSDVSLEGATSDLKTECFEKFIFVHDIMPELSTIIHDAVCETDISFTKLFQKYGNSIRKYGEIKYKFDSQELMEVDEPDIFAIPRKIVQFIKALRHPFNGNDCRPVRIVIDSIKNVFEATYLRQRYSSFYLFSISANDNIRKERLLNQKKLNVEEIQFIDWNEYSSNGSKAYKEGKKKYEEDKDNSDTEQKFYENVIKEEKSVLYDPVRKYSYENNLQQFYLQDVAASIENADVFISNNHKNVIPQNIDLKLAILRNVCLVMFPGLLTPTPIERCMQIAFAAKCNSGCLSRQVGAVVTDKDYNILSVGWNDVPCGDISCSRKNLIDLCRWEDTAAYSKYELEDQNFRKKLEGFKYRNKELKDLLRGLPMRYCFKDIHLKEKNPMRSRAMHAEEKALATCGEKCSDGYLFTTSSPCEMCSKNAKNHRIKKIYYIELYPGISESQYSSSGSLNNRAEHILYTGAVGRAYTQMYTPFMPQKDIIELLGIYKECWPDLCNSK